MTRNADWTAFWKRLPFRSTLLLKWYETLRFATYKKLLSGLDFSDFADLGGGTGISAGTIASSFGVPGVIVDNNAEAYCLYRELGTNTLTSYVRKNLFAYDKKHDLILSDGLIEHFQEPDRARLIEKHKKLARKYVLIFVPKDTWYVNWLLRFKHGYEKHYTRAELASELEAAGLTPLRVASDFHMHGVVCSAH